MRIKKIEIISFGKFKNFSLDFSDGFNLVFGKNEDGKSTVMAFICLMLYGTAGTASRTDITGNFRKKYAPWSGEKMAGDMEIECGGRSYLIHKEFRASAKTDKVTVTDSETGDAVNLPPDTEIGKYFLGIDYTAFEKSIFGSSAESFAGTESGDISERLSNLTESGDETVSSKTVMARIESAMDELVKKRSKGKIALVQDRVEELADYINQVNSQTKQREELNRKYRVIEEELTALSEKAKKAHLAVKNEEIRRRGKACRNLAELYIAEEKAKQALLETTNGQSAEVVLSECEKREKAVFVARDVLLKTEKPENEKVVTEEDMKSYFRLTEEVRLESERQNTEKNARKNKLVIAGSGLALAVLGVVAGLFYTLAFLVVVLGIAMVIPYLISLKNQGNLEKKYSAEQKLKELLQSRDCSSAEEFEKAYREGIALAEREQRFADAQKDFSRCETDLISYVNEFSEVSAYDEAEKFIKGLAELKTAYEKAVQNASSYASACGIEEKNSEILINLAQDIEKELTDDLTEEVDAEAIEEEIRAKNAELLEIKGLLGSEPDDVAPAIKELEETQTSLAEMQAYYNDLALAREVLLEAEDEMRRSFAPALKARASEILSCITNGKYTGLSTDKAYEIEVKSEETAGYRKWKYLSRGTCAQSYLALRIAVCEMLSENEAIPLFLDDVLADYDDERASMAADFLESYARENRQILFFTCHNWLGETKDKLNMLG